MLGGVGMQDIVEDAPRRPTAWSALVGTFAIMFMLAMGNCVFALTSALEGPGMSYTQMSERCLGAELVREFFYAAHGHDATWTSRHGCGPTR